MIDASVVICAYTLDRWDDLNAAIASVRKQTSPAREIILVVDNNKALLKRARREIEGIVVTPNNNVGGLCGGRVTGAGLATAPVVAFLDDDAIADERWLEELLVPYADPRVLGVGGRIEPLWRKPRPWWFPPEFNWIIGCTYRGMRVRNGGEVRNVIGANMSVRAEVLHGCGGFAGQMGRIGGGRGSANTCDDTEFCIRATKKIGGVWIYKPEASVRHVVTAERTTWKYFLHRCRMEGTSKAALVGLAGTKDGLDSERLYVLTLGRSILEYAATGKIGQALAIFVGLATTSIAYTQARARAAISQGPKIATERKGVTSRT
ncbi:MAG: glycosyltransferase family 2 protein [Mesorhizobium sp.]|uniref:glycosyltransferase family 2 protein n=1 Tax=unclassified Mesorhizobium TaxID=325217 RepID=UPI000FCB9477|nr:MULTISPECIES: glycosyltransferase family 2 protein [unclassified Mesorhizobium]RUV72385.1 glycosyltransferase family 2 protein [Mesorhizobium sp. M5C.F.Cr.IN.023.01.1.1]RWF88274.1 MAG: glycosyltransferase family 2 protein [Mesorhizobium sp.]RWF93105.1 MAG: glycosyltransferase family 2 protein [Mesorhizobium sp.]RWI42356.1 MAG: glycosyltransferase family 2 protein [Mesorhizobium sp.]RWI53576.1 MAG: glycosyltransferase family 2 protein [Mesorhizobium sp.]